MSESSYFDPPFVVPIPQSPDIRTYYFNWCFTRSLNHSYSSGQVRHYHHYQPFLNFIASPNYILLCAGAHHFELLSQTHGFPLLGLYFIVNPSLQLCSPLITISPSSTYSCPVIYIQWKDLPLHPPYQVVETLETQIPLFNTDTTSFLALIQDFLNHYYSPLHPPLLI